MALCDIRVHLFDAKFTVETLAHLICDADLQVFVVIDRSHAFLHVDVGGVDDVFLDEGGLWLLQVHADLFAQVLIDLFQLFKLGLCSDNFLGRCLLFVKNISEEEV